MYHNLGTLSKLVFIISDEVIEIRLNTHKTSSYFFLACELETTVLVKVGLLSVGSMVSMVTAGCVCFL